VPDASILSMTQFLETMRAMNEVINIPIVFDADTGYGGETNVAYAARLLEEADMGSICMEDKMFAKQSSLLPGGSHPLVSVEEFSRKIAAAKSAQKHGDMVVNARTESLIAGLGMEEALRRAEAYEKAGADLILFHSKSKTPDENRRDCEALERQSADYARAYQLSRPRRARNGSARQSEDGDLRQSDGSCRYQGGRGRPCGDPSHAGS
jgi:2-methylisocitrate lyase-like PEP mutase family enzyme